MTFNGGQMRLAALLTRGLRRAPDEDIVTVRHDGVHRQDYVRSFARAARLANALAELGVAPGDRIATLMWNNHRHFEAYLAVPLMGAVLHSLNLRQPPQEIAYILNHAEDKVLLVDEDLLPAVEGILAQVPSIRHIIVAAASAEHPRRGEPRLDWETLIEGKPDSYPWPELDEWSPMGLCYTSGTTGNPKGVVYTQRSTYLHTMGQALTDTVGLSSLDAVLQIVPMFHVLGWGYPYTSTMLGAKQVFLEGAFDPRLALDVIAQEGITFSAGVPTIWQSVREAFEEQPGRWNLSTLQRINCGASAPSHALIKWYAERLGVEMIQSWGMTETNPLGVTSRRVAKRSQRALSLDDQLKNVAKTGLTVPGVELEIFDDAGKPVVHDGKTPGNLRVRGPWVCTSYYREDFPDRFEGEWLKTGDIAKIDAENYLIISDRSKDLIKSGGEWISSIDLENHILALPQVAGAAVVAQPHPKWDERPVALIVLREGATASAKDILAHCQSKFPRWQLPDDILFVANLPLNGAGKINKKIIRENLSNDGYVLPSLRRSSAAARGDA